MCGLRLVGTAAVTVRGGEAKTQMGTEGRETFPEHLSALFEIVTQHVWVVMMME